MTSIARMSHVLIGGLVLLIFVTACGSYAPSAIEPTSAPAATRSSGAVTQIAPTAAAPSSTASAASNEPAPTATGANVEPSPSQAAVANGRQIYFTATSQRGTPITSDLQVGMMGSGTAACVTCHGPDARGGPVNFMMYSFDAPDIRFKTLSSQAMAEDHPPYTVATLERAITQGVDPAGNPLQAPMPHWSMSQADLNDLIAYLKSLN